MNLLMRNQLGADLNIRYVIFARLYYRPTLSVSIQKIPLFTGKWEKNIYGELVMGRASVFWLGLLSLLLPGFFLYLSDDTTSVLVFQGFFYDYISSGSGSGFHWLTISWLQSNYFGSPLALYLFLASFALTVLGLIIVLRSTKYGGILFLLAGLSNLGLMLLFSPTLEDISGSLSVFPLPLGA